MSINILAMEYSLPGDTVSHKNLSESELSTLGEDDSDVPTYVSAEDIGESVETDDTLIR